MLLLWSVERASWNHRQRDEWSDWCAAVSASSSSIRGFQHFISWQLQMFTSWQLVCWYNTIQYTMENLHSKT